MTLTFVMLIKIIKSVMLPTDEHVSSGRCVTSIEANSLLKLGSADCTNRGVYKDTVSEDPYCSVSVT